MEKAEEEEVQLPRLSPERLAVLKEEFPHLPKVLLDTDERLAPRREAILRLPGWFERGVLRKYVIKDIIDAPMFSLLLNLICYQVLLHIFLWHNTSHLLGVLAVVVTDVFLLGRFILLLHFMQHKTIFYPKFEFFDSFMLWILAPLFGMPPGMYRAHHLVMHHVENNVYPFDLSSTEPYQRDNFFHFLIYAGKYWVCLILLPIYAFKKGRYELAIQNVFGSSVTLFYMGFFILGPERYLEILESPLVRFVDPSFKGYFVSMVPAWLLERLHNNLYGIYAFVIPTIVTGFLLMLGNWSQHIFVAQDLVDHRKDIKSYEYNCKLTYQIMNTVDNQMTWNDGYHVTHHIYSRLPWHSLPIHFFDNLEKYRDAGVILFEGCSVFDIGISVFIGNYSFLTKHYVHLGKTKKSDEEVVKLLKSFLLPLKEAKTL